MCGICGIWYFDTSQSVNESLLHRMTEQIHHRGPDEDGFYIEGQIGLGFRRLSIIDLEGSHQPMHSMDKKNSMVFNGEIYNFKHLRQQLSDYPFQTHGDTETIIAAYRKYKLGFVEHLRGMFAIALWDATENQLVLTVDRFGKKPLYYYQTPEKIVFASELKCLLQDSDMSKYINQDAVDHYLAYGYIPAPLTIFDNVYKLDAGHMLIIKQDGTSTLREYWHPTFCPESEYDTRSVDTLADELREILIECVKIRMISDVPLGAFLSGGVDSSAIVALMKHSSNQPIKTYSVGFHEDDYDETHYAKQTADYCGVEHISEIITPNVVDILPKLIHQFDEPFADSSMIPTYYVSQFARQHVTVALSGDGGDEVFAGYNHYRYAYRHQLLQSWIPKPFRTPFSIMTKPIAPHRLKPYVERINQPVQYWMNQTEFFSALQREKLYSKKQQTYANQDQRNQILASVTHLDWLSQYQYLDTRLFLPGDILTKVDRASMLTSLEVRSPLLDYVLFDFMAKVPPQYKMNNKDSKILLKKALGDLLPQNIYHRKKQGFKIPLQEWLANPLKTMLHDILLDQTSRQRGLFEMDRVEKMITEHTTRQRNHNHRLWALLCFELWAREYSL